MTIKELDQTYILNTYSRLDAAFVSGKGVELFDDTGKRYIDLGSGIAVSPFGIADDAWINAVTKQLHTLQHTSNYYYTDPQARLAEMLCARTGMAGVFFCNSGAEANECAIKAARKYANDRYGIARPNIITLVNSFHGRTLATLSATGQAEYHKHFMPFVPGFVHVPANNSAALEAAVENNDCCAILLELVQGEGGVNALDPAFVESAAAIAKERDMLLMIDEVQTGNGRTGKLYCYEHFGLEPDIITTAKGLAGGLPLGAALFNEKTRQVLTAGTHGSTFGGNPVCAAGALNILERLDDALLSGVEERAVYIRQALHGAKGVIGLSGKGLMIGIACTRPAKDVLLGCLGRGVLVLTAKDKIRLLPALNIPFPLLEEAISILKDELAK